VALFILLAWVLRKEIFMIYIAALFAAVLIPAVDRIATWQYRSYHASRPVAILVLIVALAGGVTLFITLGMPPVLHNLHQFSVDLPARIPTAAARLRKVPFADHIGVDALAQRAENAVTASATYLVSALPTWLSHLFDILATAFLCVYFMIEGDRAYAFFLSLFPLTQRSRLSATLRQANLKISKWLVGQGLLMLILGVSSTIVFGFLHVRYFLLLGFLMGLFNIIPIAGGLITIVLSACVAALDSWAKMGGVLIFYLIYINVENAYLTPRIMRSSVNLMGLTVLIALLLGTSLAGIAGALVAVPTAALLAVLLQEYAVQQDQR
jgi:predicted PurR-regulated permease PerM